ncbi:hypothetical protein E2562_024706 [Oryza meyeriana var. granulata]|uniref:Uncharacterized protein n=1 Tax=Oryza meyeriana var. granulata TaxID=110450 RepID=A0A6G1D7L2_9ORYZ|nr:hypothetical protein E2562_024706 [Oryza meyeriana var. granulata]
MLPLEPPKWLLPPSPRIMLSSLPQPPPEPLTLLLLPPPQISSSSLPQPLLKLGRKRSANSSGSYCRGPSAMAARSSSSIPSTGLDRRKKMGRERKKMRTVRTFEKRQVVKNPIGYKPNLTQSYRIGGGAAACSSCAQWRLRANCASLARLPVTQSRASVSTARRQLLRLRLSGSRTSVGANPDEQVGARARCRRRTHRRGHFLFLERRTHRNELKHTHT